MSIRKCLAGLVGVLVFVGMGQAKAAIIQWRIADGGNDHWYRAAAVDRQQYPDGIKWTEAKAAAESLGGYLATITSLPESDFVFKNLANDLSLWRCFPGNSYGSYGPWLGGYQDPPTTPDKSANWKWVTGEP